MNSPIRFLAFLFVLLLASPRPAEAYLDPGTGSMVFQVVVGGILAALAAGRLYWRKITGFFGGKREP